MSTGGKVPVAQVKRLESFLRRPENKECFDCKATYPRWASTNLGIFICMRCAGIHRSLGVHISKVKSINMDTWEEEMIEQCEKGHSYWLNEYCAELPKGYEKPGTSSPNAEVERHIRNKYEHKLYYRRSNTVTTSQPPAPPAKNSNIADQFGIEGPSDENWFEAPNSVPQSAVKPAEPEENWFEAPKSESQQTVKPTNANVDIFNPITRNVPVSDIFGAPQAAVPSTKSTADPFGGFLPAVEQNNSRAPVPMKPRNIADPFAALATESSKAPDNNDTNLNLRNSSKFSNSAPNPFPTQSKPVVSDDFFGDMSAPQQVKKPVLDFFS